MTDQIISWHARGRWLERVTGVDVEGFRRDLAAIDEVDPSEVKDAELVPWILAAYGWTEDCLDAEMLSGGAMEAVKMGCTAVINRERGVKLVCKGGVVITCTLVNEGKARKGSIAKTRQWINRRRRGRNPTAGERAMERDR